MKGVKIFGTIRKEQADWIDEQLRKDKYYNKSHLIQQAIEALQKQDESKK